MDINNDSKIELKPKKSLTYEERRLKYKNGLFMGCVIFFKSTIGLSMLLTQYFFGMSGSIPGTLCTAFNCFLIFYTMKLITQAANKIETEKSTDSKKFQISNYDEVSQIVLGNKAKFVTKSFCLGMNMCVILINVTNFSKYFKGIAEHQFEFFSDYSLNFYKLITILFILTVLFFIVEPEKLKYVSAFASFILILSVFIMWGFGLDNIIKNTVFKNIEWATWSGLPALFGAQLYSFESIGTLFTVRQTLKKRSNMHQVLLYTFIFIFIVSCMNGNVFLIGFGQKKLRENAFQYFEQYLIIFILRILFYVSIPVSLVICLIGNSIELESIQKLGNLIKNSSGNYNYRKLKIFRIVVCTLMLSITIFVQNELYLMVLTGVFITPVIGFILPILIDLKVNRDYGKKQKICRIGLLVFCMMLNVYACYFNLTHTSESKHENLIQ